MKTSINTVAFFIIILGSLIVGIVFELFHRNVSTDIPQKLQDQAATPLNSSFDTDTLEKIYKTKNNYYEYTPSN